jgi:hypothetical protein
MSVLFQLQQFAVNHHSEWKSKEDREQLQLGEPEENETEEQDEEHNELEHVYEYEQKQKTKKKPEEDGPLLSKKTSLWHSCKRIVPICPVENEFIFGVFKMVFGVPHSRNAM